MEYSQRLTCFIDLLGFEAAIAQSCQNDEIRQAIHQIILSLSPNKIREVLDEGIFVTNKGSERVGEVEGKIPEQTSDSVRNKTPLNITQFSDSYVLSCPVDDPVSCSELLEVVAAIKSMYFHNLGMIMRGGLSIGSLIHEEGGALFGPVMIEAYKLESRQAIYPRVLISEEAYHHLEAVLGEVKPNLLDTALTFVRKAFDGHMFIDLISIFEAKGFVEQKKSEIEDRLADIEEDILSTSPMAYPKVAYLLDRWNSLNKG